MVPEVESQFRLYDDPNSDKWNEYILNKEKVRIYDDKLLCRDTGLVFTLKGEILSMITDYDFNETNSADAKQINNILYENPFDIHAKDKSFRDKHLTKNYYNKRALLASGLQEVIFFQKTQTNYVQITFDSSRKTS